MKKPTVRVPQGAEWVRFKCDTNGCTHLLYHGVRWGFVFKPKARTKLRPGEKIRWVWYTENALGRSNWGRTKEEAMRHLARSLREELKAVKDLESS